MAEKKESPVLEKSVPNEKERKERRKTLRFSEPPEPQS